MGRKRLLVKYGLIDHSYINGHSTVSAIFRFESLLRWYFHRCSVLARREFFTIFPMFNCFTVFLLVLDNLY